MEKRGNLELALKLLGRGLAAAGYREKEDILKFSEEVRKMVHEEWSGEKKIRAFIDINVLLIGAVNLVLEEETAETKVLRELLEGRIKLVTSLKQLEEITLASKRVLGGDFAGWVRYLILAKIKPSIIHESVIAKLRRSTLVEYRTRT